LGDPHVEKLDQLITKVNKRLWLTVGSIDRCGVNIIVKALTLKNVDARLIIPEDADWVVIEKLPPQVNLRFYDKRVFKEEGVCIVDDEAFAGALYLTCKRPAQRLRGVQLSAALELFETAWSAARPFHVSETRIAKPSLKALLSFMRWYLYIKLEPPVSHIRLTLKKVTFKLRVALTRLLRGRWYPFTLLEPEVQRVLREKGFKEPTPTQLLAIPKVLSGENVLVVAPTGSGKTESVILPVLSFLVREKRKGRLNGVRVLYIAPMRALAKNVTERIREYVKGALGASGLVGEWHSGIEKTERESICRSPPPILVTTPESLEAILDMWCENVLKNVRYVVVDEVHELVGSKRGEQTLILIERVKSLGIPRVQRLFLSATLPDPARVVKLLGESDGPVTIVEDPSTRRMEVSLHLARGSGISLAETLSNSLGSSKGYIVFTNSRALTEELHHQLTQAGVRDVGVYHSSIASTERRRIERDFEGGRLRGIVATRALELGIDVSGVEKVALVGSPRLPEYLVQRFGRGSHKPHQASSGLVVAIDEEDLLEILALLHLASRRRFAGKVVSTASLDVISRELVAEALRVSRKKRVARLDDIVKTFAKAFPEDATRLREIIRNLVIHLESRGVLARCYENAIALGKGFTKLWPKKHIGKFFSFIPPRKEVKVVKVGGGELGTIDYINLAFLRVGYIIRLGGSLWRIKLIRGSRIVVESVKDGRFAIPIWKSGGIPTPQLVAIEVSRLLGKLSKLLRPGRRRIKLRNVEVELGDDVRSALERINKVAGSLKLDPKFMTVEMLSYKALREMPQRLEKVKNPFSTVVTVILYPFGSLVANTIAAALWEDMGRDRVVYVVPKPLGILIVHRPGFDMIGWLLKLSEQLAKQAAEKSPYIRVVANEIIRSLGYHKLPRNLSSEVMLYHETLRQVLDRFYDLEGALRLINWLKAGCVRVIVRRVLDLEGLHALTKTLFGDILKL